MSRSANRSSEIRPYFLQWLQGLTVLERGTPSSRPAGGGVIEITLRLRLIEVGRPDYRGGSTSREAAVPR